MNKEQKDDFSPAETTKAIILLALFLVCLFVAGLWDSALLSEGSLH